MGLRLRSRNEINIRTALTSGQVRHIYIDAIDGDDQSFTPEDRNTPYRTFTQAAKYVEYSYILSSASSAVWLVFLSDYDTVVDGEDWDGSGFNGNGRVELRGDDGTKRISNQVVIRNYNPTLTISQLKISNGGTFRNCNTINLFSDYGGLTFINCNQVNASGYCKFSGTLIFNSVRTINFGPTSLAYNNFCRFLIQNCGDIIIRGKINCDSTKPFAVVDNSSKLAVTGTIQQGATEVEGEELYRVRTVSEVEIGNFFIVNNNNQFRRLNLMNLINCGDVKTADTCEFITPNDTPINYTRDSAIFRFQDCRITSFYPSTPEEVLPFFTPTQTSSEFIELVDGSTYVDGRNEDYITANLFEGVAIKRDIPSIFLGDKSEEAILASLLADTWTDFPATNLDYATYKIYHNSTDVSDSFLVRDQNGVSQLVSSVPYSNLKFIYYV